MHDSSNHSVDWNLPAKALICRIKKPNYQGRQQDQQEKYCITQYKFKYKTH